MERHRGQRQALSSGLQRQNQGQQTQTETQEVPCEHKETLPYYESDQAVAQFFQTDCGVSSAGDIQKPSEHSPGQPVLDGTA